MEHLRTLANDLRLAVRGLSRQKAWTAVAVVTLMLGIGANSALFAVVNAVLLRPLPYPARDRVVSISVETNGRDLEVAPSDHYRAWAADAKSLSAIGVSFPSQVIDTEGEVPTLIAGLEVTASYFDVLGVAPALGRVFSVAEDVKGGPPVIVLSDELWRTRFGGDPSIVGRTVTIGEKQRIVLGVMPASISRGRTTRYWMPAALERTDPPGVTYFYFAIGRLRAGTTIESARAELATISARAAAARPPEPGPAASPAATNTPVIMTLHERLYGSVRPALLILLASVGVLLLIACANVSNLLLARATRRQREFALRLALGASRWRIVQFLLCESVVLSTAGGVLGLLVPWVALGPLLKLSPTAVANVEHVQVDGTVLAVTAAVAILTGLVFGLIPALGVGRAELAGALAGSGSRATGTARQHRLRGMIVVAELATALVLLTGAGLLARSFVRATTVDPGFRPENLYAVPVSLPRTRYSDAQASEFFNTLLDRSRAVPGVVSAALADLAPLSGVPSHSASTDAQGHVLEYDNATVGPGYFATVGLAIKQGRALEASDKSGRPVVISEAMARIVFPGQNPIGQTLGAGSNGKMVVGVVADVHQRGLEKPSLSLVYRPIADTGMTSLGTRATLLVRAVGSPGAIEAAVRDIVRQMDSRILPPRMRSTDDVIAAAAAPRKFNSFVLGAFALLAATLATVGLYGVLAYLVTDRTHEIGIRMALGADRRRVLGLVMAQGTRLIVVGVVLGLVGSAASVRLLRTMLFGVGTYDPGTFVAAVAVLTGAALLACYLPARRATGVDPMSALRSD